MKKFLILLVLVASVVLLSGCVNLLYATGKVFSDQITYVNPAHSSTMFFKTNIGNITVNHSTDGVFSAVMTRTVKSYSSLLTKIIVTSSADGVTVSVPTDIPIGGISCDIEVFLPDSVTVLDCETTTGNITIGGITAQFGLKVGSGTATLKNCTGTTVINVGSGFVQLDTVTAPSMILECGNGEIDLDGCAGNADIHISGGIVNCTNMTGSTLTVNNDDNGYYYNSVYLDNVTNEITVTATNANISTENCPSIVSIDSQSGFININISSITRGFTANCDNGNITLGVNAVTPPDLKVTASGSDVYIAVDKSLPFTGVVSTATSFTGSLGAGTNLCALTVTTGRIEINPYTPY